VGTVLVGVDIIIIICTFLLVVLLCADVTSHLYS
jgi:hypothetical protein